MLISTIKNGDKFNILLNEQKVCLFLVKTKNGRIQLAFDCPDEVRIQKTSQPKNNRFNSERRFCKDCRYETTK